MGHTSLNLCHFGIVVVLIAAPYFLLEFYAVQRMMAAWAVDACPVLPLPPPTLEADLSQCDCGTVWSIIGTPTSTSSPVNLNTGIHLLFSDVLTPPAIPISSPTQAELLCYENVDCQGFLYYTPTGSQPFAYFFSYVITPNSALSSSVGLETVFLPQTSIYLIKRFEYNRCTDFTLDPYFYYFGDATRRSRIESVLCPYTTSCGLCCWNPPVLGNCTQPINPTRSQAVAEGTQFWATAAAAHWAQYGNQERLPPNANCALTPTLWTYASNCANPQNGCDNNNFIPCGGNGYCDANDNNPYASGLYSTPYYCNCFNFTGLDNQNNPLFGHNFVEMGNACQRSTLLFCTNTNNPNQICSGFSSNCQPQLLANTAPNNDYEPHCDCDGPPSAASGTGQYCEVNRCDPANNCQIVSGNAGSCQFVGGQWQCVCSAAAVGSTCQYRTDLCKNHVGDTFNCDGRGVCMQPFLDSTVYPLGTYPNYQFNSTWCYCTSGLSYGSTCQFLQCDPALITAGRGICSTTTGSFLNCLPVYSSSGGQGALLCDVDKCATTGGTVAGGPPPDHCDCGVRQPGTALSPPLTDISCYPICAKSNGVTCGAATLPQINVCVQTVESNVRKAQCACDFGYIPITAPLGTTENQALFSGFAAPAGQVPLVCEKWCAHGTPPGGWTSTNLLACNCPNTGFNTLNNHPRCDNPICQHNGIWNTNTQSCVCNGPYSVSSNCQFDTCDNPSTTDFIEGVPHTLTNGNVTCLCHAPYQPNNLLSPLDCSGSRCGSHGVINPSLTTSTPASQYCVCTSALFITVCFDPTGFTCTFCDYPACLNGGTLITNSTSAVGCNCPFPWNGGGIHSLCSVSECGTYGSPVGSSCSCTHGFTGVRCQTSPCVVNQGTWNTGTNVCDCVHGFTGANCQISPCPIGQTFDFNLNQCVIDNTGASSSSSTGSQASNLTTHSSSTAVHHSSTAGTRTVTAGALSAIPRLFMADILMIFVGIMTLYFTIKLMTL